MKLCKKFNLDSKLDNCKLDVVSNLKYYLIAPVVLILIGMILLFSVGFNKSIDFTGGTVVKVYIGETFTYEEGKTKIEDVLDNNGLVASVFQLTELEGSNYVTVKYQDLNSLTETEMSNLNQQVVEDLFAEFGYDQEDYEQANYIDGNQRINASLAETAIVNVFSGIVLASVIIVVYFLIRFGHQSAMSALISVYHDILLAIALALIVRVEINMTFVSALVAIMAYSFVNNALIFGKIRTLSQDKTLKAKFIANESVKHNMHISMTITWFAVLALLLFIFVGTSSTLPFSLVALFGVIASFYSSNFLAPALWSFVYIPKKKKPKAEKVEEIV